MKTSLIRTLMISLLIIAACICHPVKPWWVWFLMGLTVSLTILTVITDIKLNKKLFGTWYRPMKGLSGNYAKVFIVLGSAVFFVAIATNYHFGEERNKKLMEISEAVEEYDMVLPIDLIAFAPDVTIELVNTASDIVVLAGEMAEEVAKFSEDSKDMNEEDKAIKAEAMVDSYKKQLEAIEDRLHETTFDHVFILLLVIITEVLWALARKCYRGYAFTILHDIKEYRRKKKEALESNM